MDRKKGFRVKKKLFRKGKIIEEKIKAGETKVQIAKELGVSTSTLYNYLKAINYSLKHEKTR